MNNLFASDTIFTVTQITSLIKEILEEKRWYYIFILKIVHQDAQNKH